MKHQGKAARAARRILLIGLILALVLSGGFQFAHGIAQIRDLFTIIGDRPSLDLYEKYAHAS